MLTAHAEFLGQTWSQIFCDATLINIYQALEVGRTVQFFNEGVQIIDVNKVIIQIWP